MVCPYCGAELADEARFCVGCGAALADGAQTMPVAEPAVAPAPVGSPAPSKKPKKGVVIAIVCAAILVVGGGGGLAYHLYQQHVQEQYESAHSKHALVVSVKAEGWDTDNGASRVPVRVKGKTVDGKKVDKVEYVASDGSGIKLIRASTRSRRQAPPSPPMALSTRCLAQRPSLRSTTLLPRARRSTWQNSPSRIRFWTLRPSMLST